MADKNQYAEDTNQDEEGNKGGQATEFEDEGGRGVQQNPEEMEDIE